MAGGAPQVEELLAKLAELQQAGHSFFVKVLQQPYSIAAATDDKATVVRLLNELEAQFKTGLLYYMEEDDVNRGQQISPGQDLIQPKVERINSQLAATHAQRERLVKNAKTFRSRVV